MNTRDKRLLNEMRNAISGYDAGLYDPIALSHCLLALREMLEFRDRVWRYKFTYHLATLDSPPRDMALYAEQQQERLAISNAVEELRRLVDAKIAQLS